MLEIRNLRKTYGKKVALKNFNYDFKDGIYGMLGANGAGKSTLMNLLTDNLKRDSGQIFYDGEEILKMGNRYLEKVGYMPQQQGIYENFSARMFLFYMAELKGIRKKEAKSQIGQLLDIVNLSVAADKKIGSFSGGMKQRVLLAQALLRNPKILILDEPTTGLHFADVHKLVEILHKLADGGNTVVVIEHNLDVIKTADYIIDMGPEGGDGGGTVIAKGTPEQVAKVKSSYTGQYVKKYIK